MAGSFDGGGAIGALGKAAGLASKAASAPINRRKYSPSVRFQEHGILVRFSPIKGVTPKSALLHNIWLSAALNDVQVDEDALFSDYDTISAGQFSMPAMGGAAGRRLRTGSLDTLTVDFDAPWMVTINQDPERIRTHMRDILRARKPVHMLITLRPHTMPSPMFDAPVTIRSLSDVIRAGERDTRYMTIGYSEDRTATVDREQHGPATGRKRGTQLPTTHILKASDTLRSLSKEYYGTYENWRAIRDANGIPQRFGAQTPLVKLPGHFKVGAKIKIPMVFHAPGSLTGSAGVIGAAGKAAHS